ncbi:hypothetical protein [Candidatus Regiella endosymbiont of Tuberolachnus salignus]|uniref:hypothetical protein n=1 Tax=Candidatus Regiella endosymbiont of Tuberolachnus salignus TaxID=3077956 RepID=UPI0030D23735
MTAISANIATSIASAVIENGINSGISSVAGKEVTIFDNNNNASRIMNTVLNISENLIKIAGNFLEKAGVNLLNKLEQKITQFFSNWIFGGGTSAD